MQQLKQHIIFGFAIVLIVAVLFPSMVKMHHIFEKHTHEVCKGESTTHLHKINADCEFYKFKLNSDYQFISNTFQLLTFEDNFKLISSQYQHINEYQYLGIQLRGPPALYFI